MSEQEKNALFESAKAFLGKTCLFSNKELRIEPYWDENQRRIDVIYRLVDFKSYHVTESGQIPSYNAVALLEPAAGGTRETAQLQKVVAKFLSQSDASV